MTMVETKHQVGIQDIMHAHHALKDVTIHTPLQKDPILSAKYNCNVYLKREDLQVVRSFKIRGPYYMIKSLPEKTLEAGIVCASAGNHAQGVAYSCQRLNIKGKIYMPSTTPRQKVQQVNMFGGSSVEVVLIGDTFDDAYDEAIKASTELGMTFIHPFDDPYIIAGNGTVGLEIMEDMDSPLDYVFASVGGGGLAAGVGMYIKSISPTAKVIGVEPSGAASMQASLDKGEVIPLEHIDKFVDGAAVKKVGDISFEVCQEVLDDIVLVSEGKVCTSILDMYNRSAIVVEPAGALPIAALEEYKDKIVGKNVVCVISGGNNDIDRMPEIKERSLISEGLKHYFTIKFPQRAGALRQFLDDVLGPNDDITRFEYTKKNDKLSGPALVGIELKSTEDYAPLIERMKKNRVQYIELNNDPVLFNLLV
ncbi:threonine ammonia-lyase IlvA [Bacillus horti]|uniref:L-threonine dehydratase n=1 Tax=Caldalkalibacillus horti TaxID=77523 RepID=A0ABT9W1R3_9BACI|nr:threonine ammonia-lyase IlvA [Bacillus horti]MDQ0167197.1 threonine dehydratase [Bacillus horti]